MRFWRLFWRGPRARGARSEGVTMGGRVSVSCHGHTTAGLQTLVALAWAMDGAGAMCSGRGWLITYQAVMYNMKCFDIL